MALPVIERIAKEIQKRINPVAPDRASSVGQSSIVMPMRLIPDLASVVIQQQSTQLAPEYNCPGNPPAIGLETTFAINCFVKNGNNETEFSQQCHRVVADVVGLITSPATDAAMWYTFGGLALLADIGASRSLQTAIGENCGMTVPITVRYRVAENDHTISR